MKTIPAKVEVETEKNGFRMESHPIKIKIDNSDFFQSIGIKPVSVVLKDSAIRSDKAVLDYMRNRTNEKNAKLGPNAKTVAEIAAEKAHRTILSGLDFIPKERPHISWEGGYVDINYTKDKRIVKRIPSRIEFEYIPYKVDIVANKIIQEYPPEDA